MQVPQLRLDANPARDEHMLFTYGQPRADITCAEEPAVGRGERDGGKVEPPVIKEEEEASPILGGATPGGGGAAGCIGGVISCTSSRGDFLIRIDPARIKEVALKGCRAAPLRELPAGTVSFFEIVT